MDVAKLEKMKVVDLRNELQSRGLDTKGVKAVLIERLRAHVEGGTGDGENAPVTPSRRQRRTRSMSRSPSPVQAAPVAAEPVLDTLQEEEQAVPEEKPAAEQEPQPEPQPEPESELEAEPSVPEKPEPVAEAEETSTNQAENEEPQSQAEESNDKSEADDKEETVEQEAPASAPQDDVVDEPMEEDHDAAPEEQEQQEQADEPKQEKQEENAVAEHQSNGDSQKMDVDEEDSAAPKAEENVEAAPKSDEQLQERRKRSHSRSRSRSRSGSRSPKHRSSVGDKRDSKSAAEERTVPEDEPTIEENKVGLSWLDSDLHLRIDPTTFASAKPLTSEIYSLIWSGARANYGVREGKVCFEVRLAEESVPENSHYFRDEPHVRGFRVGFSVPQSSLLLGEAEHSFGYCETGRKANQGEFSDYGKPYKLDDVIGCYLDLESEPCTINYTLNGEDLGVAFEFEKSILGEEGALFPHIVTKGYEYSVNFSDTEQLLVNAERPTRKRRKPRKDEDKDKDDDKDDNDGEKWKVLDEATADDDEVEKKEEDGKTSSEKDEEDGEKPEKAKEADDSSPKAEPEADAQAEAEVEASSEAAKPEPVADESSETAETSTKPSEEAAAVSNGDASAEKTNDEKQPEEKKSSADNEEEDKDGPSPNKRPKTDGDSEKAESEKEKSQTTEDEYEDVVPEPRDTAALLEGYVLIGLVAVEQLVPGPQRAGSRKECEVILLVGLPGAGKTHWALKHVAENSDKRYELIGPDSFISKMTIDGASRKTVHKGRWDKVYEICLNSLAALEDIAMKRRRNFILDQPTSHFPRWSLAGLMT
ncbi:heterogeneous nuclear ribonucleoprotein U-like protein 2 isoform X3 [Drosophila elegans]|uniref:heterogeneous nuclear ribonucleoprotein U-like protein 2 isoform X3 n=1 Tax=Drosophila elegans TaxID=30023 RepID=UPI001BC864F1|nr:heterogeneous nuclear ribonucleoprotein U-like protein 2 isoform X3 [Drosophila elegans]